MKKFRTFLATLMAILLSFVLLFFIFQTSLFQSAESQNVEKTFEKIDILNVDLGSFLTKEELNLEFEGKVSINNIIIELANQSEMSVDLIKKVLEDKKFGQIFNKYAGDTIEYVILDGSKAVINKDVIDNLIDDISKTGNYTLEETNSVKFLMEEFRTEFNNIKVTKADTSGFPINNLYIYLGIILLTITIGLLTFSVIKPFKYISIPLIVVGISTILFSLIKGFIIEIMQDTDATMNLFMEPIVNNIARLFVINGLISIVIGIVLLVIYFVLSNYKKQKNISETRRIDIEEIKI